MGFLSVFLLRIKAACRPPFPSCSLLSACPVSGASERRAAPHPARAHVLPSMEQQAPDVCVMPVRRSGQTYSRSLPSLPAEPTGSSAFFLLDREPRCYSNGCGVLPFLHSFPLQLFPPLVLGRLPASTGFLFRVWRKLFGTAGTANGFLFTAKSILPGDEQDAFSVLPSADPSARAFYRKARYLAGNPINATKTRSSLPLLRTPWVSPSGQ